MSTVDKPARLSFSCSLDLFLNEKGKVKDYSFQLPVRRRLMRKNIKLTFMIILTEVQYHLGFYQSILSG